MEKERGRSELIEIQNEVSSLMKNAREVNWELIDKEIVPKLGDFAKSDLVALELLKFSGDDDANVRDAVATGLAVLEIKDKEVINKMVKEMLIMSTDKEKFPAARAIMFLNKFRKDGVYQDMVDRAVDSFAKRADKNDWGAEILENIPEMRFVLD